jgi:membrane associated rhomboid family serine protease
MTVTSVGMRCPECARQRTKVRTMRSIGASGIEVTQALIAINVVAFLASGSAVFSISGSPSSPSWVLDHGFLSGPTIHDLHQYYRLVTSGFLHEDLLHIGFNMYLLYVLGRMLEPVVGHLRFGVIYFTALLAGSFGALLFTPTAASLGASGAVFGLMGAAVFEMRARGVDPMASGIVPLIVINLILSLTLSNISIGAHVGGLVGGALASLVLQRADLLRSTLLGYGGCAAIAVVSGVAAVLVAQG